MQVFTRFVYKFRWFVYAQTEGKAPPEPDIPSWDKDRALAALEITEIPFDHTDGNCMGCARDRSIAINPVNPLPHKTRFHELAHVLLGHTAEGTQADSEVTPRNLRECEAEAVALVCCAALDLPGIQECRGYVHRSIVLEWRRVRGGARRTRSSGPRVRSRLHRADIGEGDPTAQVCLLFQGKLGVRAGGFLPWSVCNSNARRRTAKSGPHLDTRTSTSSTRQPISDGNYSSGPTPSCGTGLTHLHALARFLTRGRSGRADVRWREDPGMKQTSEDG